MRKIAFLIVLCFSLLCAHAETIILRTGARVKGSVVFQNEEVVIVRSEEGKRFQYPRSDVEQILSDDQTLEDVQEAAEEEEEVNTTKKASILLEVAGGAAVKPAEAVGGAVSVDLLVGSHMIAGKHIFIGGGLGYHGVFLGAEKYNFLPIEAKLSLPFIEAKHAPLFGLAIGYGIALSKDYVGGIYTDLDFGYRYQINPESALAVLVFASFQQARLKINETIEGSTYTNRTGRNFVTPGIKFALFF